MFLIMTVMLTIFTAIAGAITMISLTSTKISLKDREKMTSFECGFDPIKKARMPFSIRFFLVTIIFLIFDVEIAILLPLPMIFKMSNLIYMHYLTIIVTLILLLGLLHEWNHKALQWT